STTDGAREGQRNDDVDDSGRASQIACSARVRSLGRELDSVARCLREAAATAARVGFISSEEGDGALAAAGGRDAADADAAAAVAQEEGNGTAEEVEDDEVGRMLAVAGRTAADVDALRRALALAEDNAVEMQRQLEETAGEVDRLRWENATLEESLCEVTDVLSKGTSRALTRNGSGADSPVTTPRDGSSISSISSDMPGPQGRDPAAATPSSAAAAAARTTAARVSANLEVARADALARTNAYLRDLLDSVVAAPGPPAVATTAVAGRAERNANGSGDPSGQQGPIAGVSAMTPEEADGVCMSEDDGGVFGGSDDG
ncbi:unnamed protein product, partial [Scytosiphon promiscuus]